MNRASLRSMNQAGTVAFDTSQAIDPTRAPAAVVMSCVDRAQTLSAQVEHLRDRLLGSRSEGVGVSTAKPAPDGALIQSADRAEYVEGTIDRALVSIDEIARALDV